MTGCLACELASASGGHGRSLLHVAAQRGAWATAAHAAVTEVYGE